MTTTIRAALLAASLSASCEGASTPQNEAPSPSETATLFGAAPEAQWRLPDRLAEISGLALTPDGRLLAHDDERAVIYEIDAERGRLAKAFALGDPPLAGDFEGIAVTNAGAIYMTTSTGLLYRFEEGGDGAHVSFESFDTGLEQICEVEGLAFDRASGSLILACKDQHASDVNDAIALYAWTPARPNQAARPWMIVPRAAMQAVGAPRRVSPSAVEIDAASGRVLVLAARERMLIELSREGEALSARRLGEGHGQAEGVAVLSDGALVISDEAGQIERASLARYGRRP
ncbi:MAG: SdiA-regulated domain-containing protein [Hyphomonadaceae bacterium]